MSRHSRRHGLSDKLIAQLERLADQHGQLPLDYLQTVLDSQNGNGNGHGHQPRAAGLYERIGWAGGIRRIVDGDPGMDLLGLYDRVRRDQQLMVYFKTMGDYHHSDRWKGLRWHLREFLSVVVDAPVSYTGADLRVVHQQVRPPITSAAFDRLADHLADVLADLRIDQRDRRKILDGVLGRRSQIVADD